MLLLGGLGVQYCIKTEKAYKRLTEISADFPKDPLRIDPRMGQVQAAQPQGQIRGNAVFCGNLLRGDALVRLPHNGLDKLQKFCLGHFLQAGWGLWGVSLLPGKVNLLHPVGTGIRHLQQGHGNGSAKTRPPAAAGIQPEPAVLLKRLVFVGVAVDDDICIFRILWQLLFVMNHAEGKAV